MVPMYSSTVSCALMGILPWLLLLTRDQEFSCIRTRGASYWIPTGLTFSHVKPFSERSLFLINRLCYPYLALRGGARQLFSNSARVLRCQFGSNGVSLLPHLNQESKMVRNMPSTMIDNLSCNTIFTTH